MYDKDTLLFENKEIRFDHLLIRYYPNEVIYSNKV